MVSGLEAVVCVTAGLKVAVHIFCVIRGEAMKYE